MKKYTYLFILAVMTIATSFWGCDDLLDNVELRHSLSAEEAARTAKGSDAILSGALLAVRSTYQSPGISVWKACGTDIVRDGTNLSDEPASGMPGMNSYNGSFAANSEQVLQVWDTYYSGITFANTAINGLTSGGNVDDLDDDIKDKLGQAYTMRAFLYLELVRRFGNIPIIEAADLEQGPVFETVQRQESEVYALIISDLETAIPLMKTRNDGGDRGVLVPSKGLANLLLAEASLDMGEYQKAADAADALINDGSYSLQPLDGIFGLDGGKSGEENNAEIVFSIGFTDEIPDEVQWTSQQWMPLYDRVNGVSRTMENGGRPWSRLSPSDYYFTLFEEADGRLNAWHKRYWIYDDADAAPDGRNVGDTVKTEDLVNQFGDDPIRLRYTDPTTWKYAEDDTYGRSTAQAEGWRNIILFRYSHAYVAAAEAQFGLGNTGAAMTYLNVLRERAYGNTTGNFSSITFEDIVEEHARELGHEGHRWAFLKRNDLLVERVRANNPAAAPNIAEKHVRWPIPLEFIDQTGSTQNTGY
ncbi:RagB/SusD family nutrient uptake outer membrane protein [Marinoscillum sp.]|uniref:RagB/SusD family nutrient uptake outer membrane protein n=1 Tax=Marinoscillum sp. TaxID=2024838 RepID=UPI003BA88332